MDLLCNPSQKDLMALNIRDSVKFVHLHKMGEPKGVMTKNDFTLEPAHMPELPQHVDSYNLNCMTWCHYGNANATNALAIGLGNGCVYLVWPRNAGTADFPSNMLIHQASRPCTALACCKTQPETLAIGLEKSRSEYNLLITDLTRERSSKEHITGLLDNIGSMNGYKFESCMAESVNSVMWSDKDPKSLVAGVGGKYLRIYDIRSVRSPLQTVNTKSVYGLCQDPCLDSRFASFFENQINVWDLRSFSKPAAVIPTKYTVLKADWCPTRNGLLAAASTGSSEGHIVRVYDVSHTVVTDNDSDIAYRHVEQIVKLDLKAGENVGTFSWLQNSENKLISVTNNGALHCVNIPERISVCWANGRDLVTACKQIHHCFGRQNLPTKKQKLPDLEEIIYKRSKNGYGLDDSIDHSSPEINLAPGNAELTLFWDWIRRAKESQPISITSDMKPTIASRAKAPWNRSLSTSSILSNRFCGLQIELKQTDTDREAFAWIGIPNSSCMVYSSPQRNRALAMCGWSPIKNLRKNDFEFRQSLFRSDDVERATAVALWHLDMKLAVDVLTEHSSGDGAVQYSVVAMALSGYVGSVAAPLWKELCDNLLKTLPSPYLKAAFAFLRALTEPQCDFRSIMQMTELSVRDRIGFACTFMDDEALLESMELLSEDVAENGDLEGVVATGLVTKKGVDLLQAYVEKSKDIQTAALGLIQSGSPDVLRNEVAKFIIHDYRKLLDSWQLWKERAWFDTVLGKSTSPHKSKQMHQGVLVQCNYCGKSITHARMPDVRGRGIGMHGSSTMGKPTSCPKCRKPLPRCSVCCMCLGTSAADGDADDPYGVEEGVLETFFTWCPYCQHGGHRLHLENWFREHSNCPVSGCPCNCSNYKSHA